MRRFTTAIASAALIFGSLAGAQAANAAQVDNTNPAPVIPNPAPVPTTTALGCLGHTGLDGCGPGWIWHEIGWRGPGCYRCL